MTHREPEPTGTPGVERLLLADCERVEADHRPTPDGACVMCLYVWRRPVTWPCAAARAAARLRELCGAPPEPTHTSAPTAGERRAGNRADSITPVPRTRRRGIGADPRDSGPTRGIG